MKFFLHSLILLAVFTLTGCGFTPLHGQNDNAGTIGVADQLSAVYINNIPDREGQYLRNALIDRFYKNGYPAQSRYNLTIEPIKERITDLDITKSSDATRAQLRLNTKMSLTDNQTGQAVLERNLTSITSYNILQSQFTTRVSEDNTRLNALDDLARQIELQLSLYFNR